ncbi:hypothetical protein AAW12_14010 [Sphingobacterium sp. Ag1]|nr:hypothetical protein AAW12_14010 [Sphingobacterium sp. Ag1]
MIAQRLKFHLPGICPLFSVGPLFPQNNTTPITASLWLATKAGSIVLPMVQTADGIITVEKTDSNLVLRISIFGPTSAHIKRPMIAAEILPSSTGPVCISYADNRSNGMEQKVQQS